MIKNRGALSIAMVAALFMGTGCVPITEYNKLKKQFEKQEKYVLEHREDTKKARAETTRIALAMHSKTLELDKTKGNLAASQQLIASLKKQNAELNAGASKTMVEESRPQEAGARRTQKFSFDGFAVNSETNGIVLDQAVMFSPGSATLKSSGKTVLRRLAGRLNSSEFSRYHIQVAGHTDSSPIRRAKGRVKDNWELSGMRARAVLNELVSMGVRAKRLAFVGYSHHRPITKDNSAAGMKKNRRVEIVLVEPS